MERISEQARQIARTLELGGQTTANFEYWTAVCAQVERDDRLLSEWEQPVTVGGD